MRAEVEPSLGKIKRRGIRDSIMILIKLIAVYRAVKYLHVVNSII